jgi:hypothetical protein
MKYRIIQTSEHKFYAQERKYFFLKWEYILSPQWTYHKPEANSFLYSSEGAENLIKSRIRHLKYIKEYKKKYPIIHKLKIK